MSNSYCPKFKKKLEEMEGKLAEITPKYFEDLLLKYKATGDKNIEEKLDKINKILQEIEEFKKEYEEKVKELLREWYPKRKKLDEFIKSIKINEKGRVEIEELDVSYCFVLLSLYLPSLSLYLPSLFEKIKVLDCSHNQLTSLPELPDGLEVLDCSSNQLTSLPKLPDGLKKLGCSNNQLTSLPELPDSLEELYCSHNQLTSLPKLPDGLKVLKCSNNQLTSLPELPNGLKVFWGMKNPFSFSSETIKRIKSHPNYDPHYWLL
jgi:Leucine-rich repeat (LRR) protein